MPASDAAPFSEGAPQKKRKLGPGAELIARRHIEWRENKYRWKFLLDSLEGGNRYRNAVYGVDRRGLPVRNLIRHKREYPDPREIPPNLGGPLPGGIGGNVVAGSTPFSGQYGADPAAPATDDDYEMRRARTPVPRFVAEAVECHLSKVYGKEVAREVPPVLEEWAEDVDGMGTPLDDWMEQSIAPLLMLLGQLDIAFAHPPLPEGEEPPANRADELRLGTSKCVAAYILPENLVWWRLDDAGRYREVLILEYGDGTRGEPIPQWRHWTTADTTLYDMDGYELSKTPHDFGRVPIVRVFDRRKPRARNIGQSRYEGIAEKQREYYNRDSELVLSDTLQAHPLLQGPEDYVQADGSVPIGPAWLLPKKKNSTGGPVTYEGFDVVDFPKDGAESIRLNKADLRDEVDRDARLTKPAGTAGTSGGTVGQSGISKQLDHTSGNELLSEVAGALQRAEGLIHEYALMVLTNRLPDPAALDAIEITYPTTFNLFSIEELATGSADYQNFLTLCGQVPEAEAILAAKMIRLLAPGLDDDVYASLDAEAEAHIAAKAKAAGEMAEMGRMPVSPDGRGRTPDAEAEAGGTHMSPAEEDPPIKPPYTTSSEGESPTRS